MIVAPAYCGWLSTKSGSLRQAANRPSSNPVFVTRLRYTAGMIWSVSTLLRRSGSAVPVWVVKASISAPASVALRCTDERVAAGVVEVCRGTQGAPHGGGSGHERADQVRPAALALPALEVAVRGRGGTFARSQLVGVHAQAHRAPGGSPLGAGLLE